MDEKEPPNPGRKSLDAVWQRLIQMEWHRSTLGRSVLLVLYALSILYFGTRPTLSFPGDQVLSQDKLLHAVVFGGLGILAYRWGRTFWQQRTSRWVALASVGLATAFGALLELVQSCLPYRSVEFADLLADFVGATLCVALAKRWGLERPLLGART